MNLARIDSNQEGRTLYRSQEDIPFTDMFQEEYDSAPKGRNMDTFITESSQSPKSLKRRLTLKPDPSFKIVTIDASLKNFKMSPPALKEAQGVSSNKAIARKKLQETRQNLQKQKEPQVISGLLDSQNLGAY